jgi:Rrf2 family transcriptional regulator, iron-sulfur cluster assembly transcription factor
MKLSQESRQALNALTYLARQPAGDVVESADIAAALDISPTFLSKILQRLGRAGLVNGHRGAVRGYSLAREAAEINVRDVAVAIDGDDLFNRCVFWSQPCSNSSPCILHEEWAKVRPQIEQGLAELTIDALATNAPRKRRKR